MSLDIREVRTLDPDLADQVHQLVAGAPDAVDSPPISERALLHLQATGPFRHLVAGPDGALSGYLQIEQADGTVGVELVASHVEVATALLTEAVRLCGGRRMLLWAHGASSIAHTAAKEAGFEAVRSLFQMRRPIDDPPIPELAPPEGVVIRPFVPGQDDQAWLTVNARAFASHPEQGAWTADDLTARIGTPWFDPNGFLLADRAGTVLGFHWTKVHTADLGEVYVLGVDPDAQGFNLGQVLLAAGLRYLQGRGVSTVELYTEATNVRAVRLYGRFGFTEFSTDTQYARG